ncbi:hypothetical protein PAALTS15_20068 [Paenibacillus alvei TS-15]|jgi:hypothetical protein|uniref:Uncharacterized protein n=4 Tax=Paenibacillus TaxID=44249 RepID=S9SI65_PAEAL|nr:MULTISPECIES: hypothetical protein [Paenibacillus]EPY05497.1 hypothetical protein PAALTS15_20068 [Paenibacillus alvei TS-15]EPY10828.1 hypothetical protein PAAL66ix_21297 [Paenibacillus alvei A6-6i-x]MCY9532011.1 hypothetical protein [Paenibacillus alvei]MDT8978180.1 hypothetical protein [Paenibacillus sp. chi10]TQR43432.1 hypothetical protein C7Y44_19970 [Paenibacillus sp. SDF0028]
MATKGHNEVKESLLEMTRIFRPKNPRKFVKEYIRKYRIMGGYEDELTQLVELEMCKMDSSVS